MPPSADSPRSNKSGIQKLSSGESVIPASTRADGSVRKEIRVKPGYRPPEDVEVYKNRTAEAWKSRGKGGVPGAQPSDEDKLPLHLDAAAAGKNAKRREARKKAATAAVAEEEQTAVAGGARSGNAANGADGDTAFVEDLDPEAEKAKEARRLAKKLRQARELQDKKDKGDSMLPEQLLKVTRINELVRQLEGLGFDQDGEKKQNAAEHIEQPAG